MLWLLGLAFKIIRNTIPIFWNMDIAFLFFPVFYFGEIMRAISSVKKFERKTVRLFFLSCVLLLLSIAFSRWLGNVNVYRLRFDKPIPFVLIGGILGSICVISWSYILVKVKWIGSSLAICGRYSLAIMSTHLLIITLMNEFIGKVISKGYFKWFNLESGYYLWFQFLFTIVLACVLQNCFFGKTLERIKSIIYNLRNDGVLRI